MEMALKRLLTFPFYPTGKVQSCPWELKGLKKPQWSSGPSYALYLHEAENKRGPCLPLPATLGVGWGEVF